MSLIVCLSDYWHQRHIWRISLHRDDDKNECPVVDKFSALPGTVISNAGDKNNNNNKKLQKRRTYRRLFRSIDGIATFYFLCELQHTAFRSRLLQNARLHQTDLLWLQIVPPEKEIIDYKWNSMVSYSLWERIELDYLMSWLSTLGGGFSALGEQFSNCAQTAGKISMKQLEIGLRLGDPFMQARCKLYYSLSLIQTGRLRAAKYIVRAQYRFANRHREQDSRLVKMCHGIWLRIVYEYEKRKAARKFQNAAGDNDTTVDRVPLTT